jgi:hypothetical protein
MITRSPGGREPSDGADSSACRTAARSFPALCITSASGSFRTIYSSPYRILRFPVIQGLLALWA